MNFRKINWEKIESDIDEDGNYIIPIENGPGLQYMYQRVQIGDTTYCPGGGFVGLFLGGVPIHTRIPYDVILYAADAIKQEILHRKFVL